MGFFGGGSSSNDPAERSNRLMEEQISQNKQELEQKRSALVKQRLSIIKSEGAQNWQPDRSVK